MMNEYKVPRLKGGNNKNNNKSKSKKNNKKDRFFTAGRIVLLTFLSLLFIFFLFIYLFLNVHRPTPPDSTDMDFGEEFLASAVDNPDNPSSPASLTDGKNADCYTFLIVGTENDVNTDTIMIAMFNVKENTISILNIPRDSYVTTKNFSGKIGNVYNSGRGNANREGLRGAEASQKGMEYLKEMIRFTLGIKIDYHLLINMEAVKVLVDKVDGVYFNVPLRMKYTSPDQNLYIDLQAGWQTLYGEEAEQVIRFRQSDKGYPDYYSIGYPGMDIGRIKTQQNFLAALAKKMLNNFSPNTIKNLFDVGSKYMTTNLSAADVSWFVTKMTNVKLENIRFHTLPGVWIGYTERQIVYKQESMEIINKYYNPYKSDIPESSFNIYDDDLIYDKYGKPEIDIDGVTANNLGK